MIRLRIFKNVITLEGELILDHVSEAWRQIQNHIGGSDESIWTLDLSEIQRIDSAGVALLDELDEKAKLQGFTIERVHIPGNIKKAIEHFSSHEEPADTAVEKASITEKVGGWAYRFGAGLKEMVYLVADAFDYSGIGLVKHKGMRRGEFINQSILIGMNALPIVALIAFLIGFILALQSAAQLRQFGASIFVADLVAISMAREMGPLMTAIIFAGRSGSSIASEIATMVVTEETDALKSMGLNPIRYVLVPKIYAISVTMPLLTVLAILIGIVGAGVIAFTYLDIGIGPFYNQVVNALALRDIVTGLVKSIVFALIIVLVGAFYGFRVKGGSEGVGRATTSSVVTSIFGVILADSILGLIFYLGQDLVAY